MDWSSRLSKTVGKWLSSSIGVKPWIAINFRAGLRSILRVSPNVKSVAEKHTNEMKDVYCRYFTVIGVTQCCQRAPLACTQYIQHFFGGATVKLTAGGRCDHHMRQRLGRMAQLNRKQNILDAIDFGHTKLEICTTAQGTGRIMTLHHRNNARFGYNRVRRKHTRFENAHIGSQSYNCHLTSTRTVNEICKIQH